MQNHYKEYKTTEIKRIKELYSDGVRINRIAKIMGRSYGAMSDKCRALGLRRYKKESK